MSRTDKVIEYKKARKNPKGPVKRLYSIPEAAHYLGRTVDGLREMIWAGRLPCVHEDRRVMVDIKDMDEYIEKNKMRFTY